MSRLVSNLLLAVGGLALLAMVGQVTADVALRYLTGRPITGTIEFVQYYYMVPACFLPLAIAQYARGHVIVELFTHNLPLRPKMLIDTFALFVVALYTGFLLWAGVSAARNATRTGEMLPLISFDLQIWPARWVMCAGLAGMLLVIAVQIARRLRGLPDETLPHSES